MNRLIPSNPGLLILLFGLPLFSILTGAERWRVTRVEGKVWWIEARSERRRPALPGTALGSGDLLVTLPNSRCEFTPEGSATVFRLEPGSAARMPDAPSTVPPIVVAGILEKSLPMAAPPESRLAENRAHAAGASRGLP